MTLEKVMAAMKKFFATHQNERFYALIIDAGSIGLSSEEAFEKRRQQYAERWKNERAPLDLAKLVKCSEQELEDDYYDVFRAVKGNRRNPPVSLEDAVARVNAERQEEIAAGNPYETEGSEEWTRLRWNTATYGELVSIAPYKEYDAHYNMDGEKQKTSAYAKRVRAVLDELEANRAKAFAGVKLSDAFKMTAREHEY